MILTCLGVNLLYVIDGVGANVTSDIHLRVLYVHW